jgi:hypothetical protein
MDKKSMNVSSISVGQEGISNKVWAGLRSIEASS